MKDILGLQNFKTLAFYNLRSVNLRFFLSDLGYSHSELECFLKHFYFNTKQFSLISRSEYSGFSANWLFVFVCFCKKKAISCKKNITEGLLINKNINGDYFDDYLNGAREHNIGMIFELVASRKVQYHSVQPKRGVSGKCPVETLILLRYESIHFRDIPGYLNTLH